MRRSKLETEPSDWLSSGSTSPELLEEDTERVDCDEVRLAMRLLVLRSRGFALSGAGATRISSASQSMSSAGFQASSEASMWCWSSFGCTCKVEASICICERNQTRRQEEEVSVCYKNGPVGAMEGGVETATYVERRSGSAIEGVMMGKSKACASVKRR